MVFPVVSNIVPGTAASGAAPPNAETTPEIAVVVDKVDGKNMASKDDLGRTARTAAASRGSTGIFETREGRAMKFQNIVVSVGGRNARRPSKVILNGVTGHIPPRRVTAAMGPSGSGKTSLLKVLTGRAGRETYAVSGLVKLDGREVDPRSIEVRREIAYVEQDVSIPVTTTPREAIRFSARLRLDRSATEEGIELLVGEILTELGLNGCADTMIGGGLMMPGGLSGGEKKRAQCGIELVTKPSIIILDEPTSGLDSFSAEQLVDVLKIIAHAGATVLLTIHQPPPTVVRKLDHLILLLSGRLVYDGAMGHQLYDFFAQKGYPKPNDCNIADWIMASESDDNTMLAVLATSHNTSLRIFVRRMLLNHAQWKTWRLLASSRKIQPGLQVMPSTIRRVHRLMLKAKRIRPYIV